MDEVGDGEYVDDVAPPIGELQSELVDHVYEYDGVPPDACDVSVID